jgi:hypothetical protein
VSATPLVTVDYLLALPGFGGQTDETLDPLIEQASGLVIDQVSPLLDDTDDTTCPSVVATVISAMIRRGLSNPRGAQQETLGDYSYALASDGGIATLYLTKREARLVRKAVGKLGATTMPLEGYLPVQRSELYPVMPVGGGTDPWDAVTAATE